MQKIIIVTAFILIVSGGYLFYSYKNTQKPTAAITPIQTSVSGAPTPTLAPVPTTAPVKPGLSQPSPTAIPSPTLIPPGTQKYTMPDMTLPMAKSSMNAKNYSFDAPKITAKVRQLIQIDITSSDADFGFAVKELNVNAALTPGKKLSLQIVADRAGTFDFVCTSNCDGHTELGTQLVIQ
jgi:heme/copper-type cytochrome/quinol oxidase subunit 2